MKKYIVNFDVEPADVENYEYMWKRVVMPLGIWDYAPLLAAIIRAAYPDDDMAAINNNYLSTLDGTELTPEKRAEYQREHLEMNTFRDHAKAVAKELLAYAENHNL